MIANINPRGHSFAGVSAYLLHDKGAQTSERVMWSETRNLHTDDVEKASRFMAWTDMNRDTLRAEAGGSATGRKAERGNVYYYSLSWKPGREVTPEEMRSAAEATIERLGLSEHQAYLVAHSGTEHAHVHVVANLVHPVTGLVASNYRDRKTLDRWAYEYDKEHQQGPEPDCKERAKKYKKWEQAVEEGRELRAFTVKANKAALAQTVTDAFHRSDNGRAFAAALEGDGLALARGSRRALVVVDRAGEVYALNRLIDLADGAQGRAKSKVLAERLQDVDADALPKAEALSSARKSFDRDAAEAEQQNALARAAEVAAEAKTKEQDRQQRQRREQQARAKAKEAAAALVRERAALWKDLQKEVARKTKESREKWQIDELGQQIAEAKSEAATLRGFWARVFKRRRIARVADRIEALQQTLGERTERFRADVRAFSSEPSEWYVKRDRELMRLEGQLRENPADRGGPSPDDVSPEEQRRARIRDQAQRAAEDLREGRHRGPDRGRGPEMGR